MDTPGLYVTLRNDDFSEDLYNPIYMHHYTAMEMEVDGVSRRSEFDWNHAPMISIKNDNAGWSSPWVVTFDDHEIDEEHYIKYGCIKSTTEDKLHPLYCEDRYHCDSDADPSEPV